MTCKPICMQKARIRQLTQALQRWTPLLSVQVITLLTETIKKQLNRTDRVYSPSSITKTILAYIKTLVENNVFKHCCRHLQDRVANFFRDIGNIPKNKINQEVDINLSFPSS